jgi:beta-galactosidase
MKTTLRSGWLLAIMILVMALSACKTTKKVSDLERDRSFNNGWLFLNDSTLNNGQSSDFDDASWSRVDLPHDWSVQPLSGGNSDTQIGPFSKKSPGGTSTGHVLGGTGWYRKHFTLKKEDEGKTVVLRFDGSYMETTVWVNGKPAGEHTYGYSPFWFDITSLLHIAGEENTIAVQVVNTGRNSRWYSGSGLFRNVSLTITDPVHTAVWGVQVQTPVATAENADLVIGITVNNDLENVAGVRVTTRIQAPDGNTVLTTESNATVPAGAATVLVQKGSVTRPLLWSIDNPFLYTAEITVEKEGKTTDVYRQTFGIRKIEVSAKEGLKINGEPIELKGGCLHHDNGLLGSAAFERAEVRRVQIMKANGYNAIRTSHNPPSEAFLNACDSLGMVVIDEAFDMWERPKNPQDYHRHFKEWWKKDLESMILRDRNHPSVIFWSIGNEINERADTSGSRIAKQLVDAIQKLDSSRFSTAAVCFFWDHPELTWKASAPAFTSLDVGGYNYTWAEYESDHRMYPERIMMGTESFPLEVYENWQQVLKLPWVIGDFVWTAMDYLGESGIGHTQYLKEGENDSFAMPWPWFNAWCGDIDITGYPKPQKLYKDVVWGISTIEMNVHSLEPEGKKERTSMWGWPDEYPSWNWKGMEGKLLRVTVYSSAPSVKLELNGKLVGKVEMIPEMKQKAVFTVPYAPGELRATAMDNGRETGVKVLQTTGEAKNIKITADRNPIQASRNDLCYVSLELTDQSGNIVTDADTTLRISFWGNGQIVGSGNANPADMESFGSRRVRTFKGKAMLILRPFARTGKMSVRAEARGLTMGSIDVMAD